jgi:hypothetical protein
MMISTKISRTGAAAALCALSLCVTVSGHALPEQKTPPAVTIPTPPAAPRGVAFADEVTGRHLVYDTRMTYRTAVNLAFTVRYVGVTGGAGESVVLGRYGSEAFRGEVAARKLSLTTDRTAGDDNGIRHTISDGATMTTTHYVEQGTAKPVRTFTRLPLDDGADLRRALEQVQVAPESRAAEWAIDPEATAVDANAIVWRSGGETEPDGTRAEIVDQYETPNRNQANRIREHRYCIDGATHRLLRYEEWDIDTDRARAPRRIRKRAIGNKPATVTESPGYPSTINYRREDYAAVRLSKTAAPASQWAASVPTAYVEQALPSVNLPPLTAPLPPDAFAPQALALIERWNYARERFVSLSTDIEVSELGEVRTEESRPLNARLQQTTVLYSVVRRRPGKTRVLVETRAGGGGRVPKKGIAVSDGQRVTAIIDGDRRQTDLRDAAALFGALNNVGMRDPFNALALLFSQTPNLERYDKVTYDGVVALDNGESAEAITLHRDANGRNGQTESDATLRLFFGRDGFPHMAQSQFRVTLNGRLERDQPPVVDIDTRFRNLTTDHEPSANAFARP